LLEDSGFVVVLDQVVDSLLPKEHQMRKVPGLGGVIDVIKPLAEGTLPNLVATVFLFCCHSANNEASQR
jgi:hypothetical protein